MKKAIGVLALMMLLGVASSATTLTNQNSSLFYNDVNGFLTWSVDGIDHLYYEGWYYRVGSGAGAALTGPSMTQLSPNVGQVTYLIPSWGTVTMLHTLLGNYVGSNNAQWSTTISFTRSPGVSAPLHFYNYSDYDLSGSIYNDTARRLVVGYFTQADDLIQLDYTVSRTPNFVQVGLYSGDPSIDINANLNNNPGPFIGDVFFASQFVITGSSFSYSIDRTLSAVPEPATYALIGAGLLGLGLLRRRLNRN